MNWLWVAIVGKFGLGFAVSAACIAGWWFIPEIPWFTSKARTALLFIGVIAGSATVGYGKGVYDEHASYKAKIERQIKDASARGNEGRERALREFDAGRMSDSDAWFRD